MLSPMTNALHSNLSNSIGSNSTGLLTEQTTAVSLPLPQRLLISAESLAVFEKVLDHWINSILAFTGLVNNILVLIVYTKLGFNETVNITMTAIAIWNLINCSAIGIGHLGVAVRFISVPVGASWTNISVSLLGYLASIANDTSGVLATYVAIKRCLCITMPFTVKSLFTQKSVTVTCLTISILVPCSYAIVYAAFDLVPMTDPTINKTVIMYMYNDLNLENPAIMLYIFNLNIVYQLTTLTITSVCAIIIVYNLRKATIFRSKIKGEDPTDGSVQLSGRDRQVVKMLVVIICTYVSCIIPRISYYLALSIKPEFQYGGVYPNLLWLCYHFVIFFSLIDSSVNIYIFYFMNSQFHQKMKELFHLV